jgi:hypothetical protein
MCDCGDMRIDASSFRGRSARIWEAEVVGMLVVSQEQGVGDCGLL